MDKYIKVYEKCVKVWQNICNIMRPGSQNEKKPYRNLIISFEVLQKAWFCIQMTDTYFVCFAAQNEIMDGQKYGNY